MDYEEDLKERIDAEVAESKQVHKFNLKVTMTKYGTVTVEAHSFKEAEETVKEFLDEDEIDWNDWDTEVEEDDYDWDYEGDY